MRLHPGSFGAVYGLVTFGAVLGMVAHAGASDLPVCGEQHGARWSNVRDHQFLVLDDSQDTTRFLGLPALPVIAATDGVHKWIPKDIVKHSLCGTLDHVGFFHNITAEYDWDNYIKPAPAWKAFAQHPAAEPCEQDRQARCVSAEITPPPRLRLDNAWWDWSTHSCSLVNRNICVYGPWVGDGGHGNRPEIHPAQALWWREAEGRHKQWPEPSDPAFVLLVQDGSARFEHAEQFERNDQTLREMKARERPWSPWVPEHWPAKFQVWFEVEEGKPPTFDISASGNERESDLQDPHPARAWPEHGDNPLLQWTRSGPSWRSVSVEPFTREDLLCRTTRNGREYVRGYFVVRAILSDTFCGTCAAQGYNLIAIRTDPPRPDERDPLPARPVGHFLIEERATMTDSTTNTVPIAPLAQGEESSPDLGWRKVVEWQLTVRTATDDDRVGNVGVTWRVLAGAPGSREMRTVEPIALKNVDGIERARATIRFSDDCTGCDYLVEATISSLETDKGLIVRDSKDNELKANTLLWHLYPYGRTVVEGPDAKDARDRAAKDGLDHTIAGLATLAGAPSPQTVVGDSRSEEEDKFVLRRLREAVQSARSDGILSNEELRWLTCEIRDHYSPAPMPPLCDGSERPGACCAMAVEEEIARRRQTPVVDPTLASSCCTAQQIGLRDRMPTR